MILEVKQSIPSLCSFCFLSILLHCPVWLLLFPRSHLSGLHYMGCSMTPPWPCLLRHLRRVWAQLFTCSLWNRRRHTFDTIISDVPAVVFLTVLPTLSPHSTSFSQAPNPVILSCFPPLTCSSSWHFRMNAWPSQL